MFLELSCSAGIDQELNREVCMPLAALIFDVEGTLIDCVPYVIACWQTVLASAGYAFSREELQRYSGMDGGDMLERLLPAVSKHDREALLERQATAYRRDYLPLARSFDGIRGLFEQLKARGLAIGIATTCSTDELRAYDRAMRVLELADAVACAEDAKKGKPHPDLCRAVLDKLRLTKSGCAMAVGDTPYDVQAAAALGMPAAGVLTGGFSRDELAWAGCSLVLREVKDLASHIAGRSVAPGKTA